jgi:D-arabinose 1-dehydrogenase-like Zn-dependent alcohol dehydrogenase
MTVLRSRLILALFLVLQVTVFSTSEKKRAEALKTLKADHFVVSKDEEQMNVSPLFC